MESWLESFSSPLNHSHWCPPALFLTVSPLLLPSLSSSPCPSLFSSSFPSLLLLPSIPHYCLSIQPELASWLWNEICAGQHFIPHALADQLTYPPTLENTVTSFFTHTGTPILVSALVNCVHKTVYIKNTKRHTHAQARHRKNFCIAAYSCLFISSVIYWTGKYWCSLSYCPSESNGCRRKKSVLYCFFIFFFSVQPVS